MTTRPRFHLTPVRNWMNDPNGLVHLNGVWHAFFQYNPGGVDWGNMSWGHSSSTDLARWREHPVALRHGAHEQIYSGSVVVDDDGTLTATYTSAYAHGIQAQSVAVSRDGGASWQPDPANPILDRGSSDFRDPKVIRVADDGGSGRWVMVAVEAVERRVLFYASDDLRTWRETGSFGPLGDDGVVWECPDLIRLHVDDDPAQERWVLLLSTNPVGADADPAGSAMHYVVGSFEAGVFFASDERLHRLDHGRDFYAGVTFDSTPDDEAIMLAWMSNWRYAHVVPATTWRGAMSLPRRLSLRAIAGGERLFQHPVSPFLNELEACDALDPRDGVELSSHVIAELRWEPSVTGDLRLRVTGQTGESVEILHDRVADTISVVRDGNAARALHPDFAGATTAPIISSGTQLRLLLSLDGPLLEVFLNDGESTLSNLVTLGAGPVTLLATAADSPTLESVTLQVVDVADMEKPPTRGGFSGGDGGI